MYAITNRNKVILDVVEQPRYIKLQPLPSMIIGCDSEDEASGVLASDSNTIYTLIKSDTTCQENAVNVVAVDSVPNNFRPCYFMFNDDNEIVFRYTVEEYQRIKQDENKTNLASFLDTQFIEWTDGKRYGVSKDDQDEIISNLSAYSASISSNTDNPFKLMWHAHNDISEEWSFDDLTSLLNKINQFIYPYYRRMQQYKTEIYEATTIEEIDAINCEYKSIEG